MFQVERLKVVEETLKQVENELATGDVDKVEREKEIVQSIDDTVTKIKCHLSTMRGADEE